MTGERVLVVDDEPQILRFLKPSLEAAGYDVHTAATGTEALKAAATYAPDLVLLDLGLPDMDGKDVIRSCGHGPRHPSSLFQRATERPRKLLLWILAPMTTSTSRSASASCWRA